MVYFEILGKIARGLGHSTEFQYSVPPTNGWTIERVIQIQEDMLRSCVIDLEGSWDRHISLVEFVYNNSFQ